MLLHRTSHRFASQHALEQERRLAWFATNDERVRVTPDRRGLRENSDERVTETINAVRSGTRDEVIDFAFEIGHLASLIVQNRQLLNEVQKYTTDANVLSLLDARINALRQDGISVPESASTEKLKAIVETLLENSTPQLLLGIERVLQENKRQYDLSEVVYDPNVETPPGCEKIPAHGTLLTADEFLRTEKLWLTKSPYSNKGDLAQLLPTLLDHELLELADDLGIFTPKNTGAVPVQEIQRIRYIVRNYSEKMRRRASQISQDTGEDMLMAYPPRQMQNEVLEAVHKRNENALQAKSRQTLQSLESTLQGVASEHIATLKKQLPEDAISHVLVEHLAPLLRFAKVTSRTQAKDTLQRLCSIVGIQVNADIRNDRLPSLPQNEDILFSHAELVEGFAIVEDISSRCSTDYKRAIQSIFGVEAKEFALCETLARKCAAGEFADAAERSLFISYASETPSDEVRNALWQNYSSEQLQTLAGQAWANTDQAYDAQLQRVEAARQSNLERDVRDLPAIRERLQQASDALEKLTLPDGSLALQHPTLRIIGAQTGLAALDKRINDAMSVATSLPDSGSDSTADKRKKHVRFAAVHVELLEEIVRKAERALAADNIIRQSPAEVRQATGNEKSRGYYVPSTGKIVLRNDLPTNEEASVLHHELGHALYDVFTRKSPLFAGTPKSIRESLSASAHPGADGKTSLDALRELAAEYGWNGIRADNEALENELLDELINRYASWVRDGRPERQGALWQKERPLYALLERLFAPEQTTSADIDEASFREKVRTDVGDDPVAPPSDTRSTDKKEIPKTLQIIRDIQSAIQTSDTFIEEYPNIAGIQNVRSWIAGIKQQFESDIRDPYYTNRSLAEEIIVQRAINLKNFMKDGLDEISRYKQERLDLSGEQKSTGSNIRDLWNSVNFVSINDIISVGKSAWEDLQRQWKRRRDKSQAALGDMLTGWIDDKVPYLGELKREFQKRSNNSELEEVKVWKDGLSELDSYALLDLLDKTYNKDQLRAIIELLTEKGMMNWNHEGFWNVLNSLSGFQMPTKACRNNDVLRDKWLQMLITDIWGDKEHFYNWRRGNDSNYQSGTEKFTSYVDTLANVDGGMSGELRRMLKKWKLLKPGESVPNDINPHKYEKILVYAMGNGKMTMEGKMYYLIQGLATGILSLDRLRTFGGESGGLLSRFPLLEYFYQKNNTLPEIQKIAKLIEEPATVDDPDKIYKPGQKTTLWIHLDVLRDEQVRQRVSKATSGERLQNIDHEDIPTLAAILNYNDFEQRVLGKISGDRAQLSPEAQRNVYTGFSNKFKILGRLAQLAKEGKARFTKDDAMEFAKSVASALIVDNVFTRNACDKPDRPRLTWDDINTTTGPSTGGLFVKDIRNKNQSLIQDLVQNLPMDWNKVKGDANVDAQEYVRGMKNENEADEKERDVKGQAELFKVRDRFAAELQEKVVNNIGAVIDVLAEHADSIIPENGSSMSEKDIENFFASAQ